MARLIPDFISDDCKSSAERRAFIRFKDELSDEFVVIHSLGVARHRYKPYSEADFVVVCRRAVIVFELKGGRVVRKDGCWFFTNRYGEMFKRRESPMQQAASVCVALRNSVSEYFGDKSTQSRVAFGNVVFLPDIEFTQSSPEWDLRRVYDIKAWRRPLLELVADAIEYSCSEMARITKYSPSVMSPEEVANLVHYLRGDFEKLPALSVTVADNEQQMVHLAEQQYAVLDGLAKNQRMIIEGSAGTGKTLLAMESARRHAEQGRRVLLVCFSRLLADHLESYALKNGLTQGISIDTLHGHCISVIRAAGISIPTEISERELYQDHIPSQIPAALSQIKEFKPWDVLIVDEGQDLASHAPFVIALNELFVGGFERGKWIWFEDPRQRILSQGKHEQFNLKDLSPSYFELTRNWRNTNEVAVFTCVSTMFELPELSGIHGPQVTLRVCDGTNDLLKLHQLVTEILNQGARPEDIVLLTAGTESDALFIGTDSIAGKRLVRYDSHLSPSAETLRYSSAFRFKGLESGILILTNVCGLRSALDRMTAYVGMSRAKSALFLLLTKEAQQEWDDNRLNFGNLGSPASS